VSGSPCSRCALGRVDKSNTTCSRCKARVLYAATLSAEIEPPHIDMSTWVFRSTEARGVGRPKACTLQPVTTCATAGCTRRAQGPRSPYCHTCTERNRQRNAKGIPLDAPIGHGRGNRRGKFVPHAGCIGFT
jgi:hypothetical protein